jgi:hypothetical protein
MGLVHFIVPNIISCQSPNSPPKKKKEKKKKKNGNEKEESVTKGGKTN